MPCRPVQFDTQCIPPLQTAVFWLSNCPLCATRLFHSPQCHRDMCHRDICLPILWLVRQRKRVFCHCWGSLKGGGCRLYPHPQNLKPKTHRCRLDEITSFRWFFVSIFLEFCCLYLTVNVLVMHLRYPFRDQRDIYCMSHLQIIFSGLLVYQYPTSSPCCYLPWTISTPWNQSQCTFLHNSHDQMLLCAMLREWLSVVRYFQPILSVFQWDKRDRSFYILWVVIYDAFIRELSFVLRNTFQVTWYCVFVTFLVFQYLCLGWLFAFQDIFLEVRAVRLSLTSLRVMSLTFNCTIAVYSKREAIFLGRRGIPLTLCSQL